MIVPISESNPKILCQYVLLKAKIFFVFFNKNKQKTKSEKEKQNK